MIGDEHQMAGRTWIKVEVVRVQDDCGEVKILDLALPSGAELPPFEPGSHVALQCGGGLIRHYSLCGSMEDLPCYRIAVKRERESRGGSIWIHENARAGRQLLMSTPRNNFPLAEGRSSYLFISGGIGLTPIIPMLRALRGQRKRARLVHLCRAPSEFSFRPTMEELSAFHDIHVHFDSAAGCLYDLVQELRRAPRDAEVYCCGPAPLMRVVNAFGEAEGLIRKYHFEFFGADPDQAERTGSVFNVVLNSTGRELAVEEGESILAALRSAGLSIESECEEGVCGTCAIRVLAGTPDHRDQFLTEADRQENSVILVCVSRAKSKRLVLDI